MSNEPLGLPRGSVRAIITLALIVVLGLILFVPVADGADEARTTVLVLVGIAVRDYFAVRADQNDEDGPPVGPPSVG